MKLSTPNPRTQSTLGYTVNVLAIFIPITVVIMAVLTALF